MSKTKVYTVFGTRPEAIKMAPVVLELKKRDEFECKVIVTGQHRQMLDQVLEIFRIVPDYDLNIMKRNQDLFDITSNVMMGMKNILGHDRPDLILVHGDTTTCVAAALSAFYLGIPVGHVEAGLRTGNLQAPFPEEANRSIVGRIADIHFAPTESSRENLLNENIDPARITVTGNTVIDALLDVCDRMSGEGESSNNIGVSDKVAKQVLDNPGKIVLVTGHRRERAVPM